MSNQKLTNMKTKCTLLIFSLLFFVFTAYAQQGINYKAIINDMNGHILAEDSVKVQFTILENGTASVYQEFHNTATDRNGIIIVNIGEGNAINGDFNSIDWGRNPHFLKTEIDIGNGLKDMGTTEFKAVPYALYAKDGPGATELNDLRDAKTTNTSVYIGDVAGVWDDGSTERMNTALGALAGAENLGKGNVFIGYRAGMWYPGDNKLFIHNSDSYSPLILGDFANKMVTINGELNGEDSGDADMKAYIYGSINSYGTIMAGSSGGFYTEHISNGKTFIKFTGANKPNSTQYIVQVTQESDDIDPNTLLTSQFIKVIKRNDGFYVLCYDVPVTNHGGDFDFNSVTGFSFVVYKK